MLTEPTQHPDLTPADTWRSLFDRDGTHATTDPVEPPTFSKYFTASKEPAHKEILRILRESPENTVTIIPIGPLTNIALAAAEDPETFLRVKEVVVMGGAVHVPGNITPAAEFNCFADPIAAARVYALTSPVPSSTMPPTVQGEPSLGPYPEKLSKRLPLTLFPLDITNPHLLNKSFLTEKVQSLIDAGSPLARWIGTFMFGVFRKIESMSPDGVEPGLSLNDPLCVWYMMTRDDPAWKSVVEDLRIETAGQWTLGMHVVDEREQSKGRKFDDSVIKTNPEDPLDAVEFDEVPNHHKSWFDPRKGNRINRVIESPGAEYFQKYLLNQIFG